MLYDSLHHKLLTLPDDTLVYPAHGVGSMCGRSLSLERCSTIGQQKLTNYALQPMTRDEFIRMITADRCAAPAYFSHDAVLNRQERDTLDRTLAQALTPLALEDVLRLQNSGATILDVRDRDDFALRHLIGSLNIGLGGKYATWAGTMLAPSTALVLVARPGTEQEAALRLGRIGFDRVAGYLAQGPQAWEARLDLTGSTPRLSPAEGVARLAAEPRPGVLDVRLEQEWQAGHVPGSINVPLQQLRDRLDQIPRSGSLIVHCQSGYRSSIAASVLKQHGVHDLADLAGGIQAWQAAGGPVETGEC